ncbi:baseplate J/gp47 family protein [Caballeronia sp. INDeC2]|uniref:baseplate J/gp47 family protein n=1 Tax=Caballeronia sp. INDeC2 TaxID=2921747 RepID=UPI0020293E9E|nr:baseplate J/gp47 family protein [Caballeronia sp. INDeC2]
MITTTAPTIDATGISAPAFSDILDFLKSKYQGIYGPDTYLEDDSKDGQLLAIFASCINDANAVAISVYNAFSPATAQGANLSSVVKINGIARAVASASTVDVTIVGVVGTTITNGIVQDTNQVNWDLPASVTIPPAGQITVTATCEQAGAISAAPGTVTTIATPTSGWQTVTNASAALLGNPVEEDADLRVRQSSSTALPSLTVLDGIIGAVKSVTGVTRVAAYENDTNIVDSNGLPPHVISLVVEGGDATAIANAIATKKTPGGGTYGTTTVTVTDIYGIPHPINLFRPTPQAITAVVNLKALSGYSSAVGSRVQQAVSDYVNSVAIGGGAAGAVEWDACIAAAKGVVGGNTFKITSLTISGPGGAGAPDVPLAFNQSATCTPASVTVNPT